MDTRAFLKSPVYWESVVLSLICLFDAFWTVLMVNLGYAKEANPMMAFFLSQGAFAFVAVKVASFLPAIVATEYLKLKNRRFALTAVRFGIIVYLLAYVLADMRINQLV